VGVLQAILRKAASNCFSSIPYRRKELQRVKFFLFFKLKHQLKDRTISKQDLEMLVGVMGGLGKEDLTGALVRSFDHFKNCFLIKNAMSIIV